MAPLATPPLRPLIIDALPNIYTQTAHMCVLSVYCHDDIIGICLSFPFFFYFLFSPFNSPGEIDMNEVERA